MSHGTTTNPPYDSTVEQLYHAANDVEMQDAFPTTQKYLHVVIDTNVLIDYCGIIEQFCTDVEKAGYPILIIIPSVVLGELDGLKNRPELQWFARQATTWLLKKVKERRTVKLQSAKETQRPAVPPSDTDDMRKNDLAIRDCCLFFADKNRGHGALVVSMDKILILECQKEGLDAYIPPRRSWSSRLFAEALGLALDPFHEREAFPRYRPSRTRQRLAQTEAPAHPAVPARRAVLDDDMMDIDEGDVADAAAPEEYLPTYAWNALHAQFGEHFTLVLKDLCCRVHLESGDSMAVSNSKHAPEWRRRAMPEWSADLCLAYLRTKKAFVGPEYMGRFLLPRGVPGWKKGQDWSPKMWELELDGLEEVGRTFQDGALLSSVAAVRPHIDEVMLEEKLQSRPPVNA